MIIVTGGAGFIGSNIVKKLNLQGHTNILVVDDLTQGEKFKNIADCLIQDYLDKDEFLAIIKSGKSFAEPIQTIFHQGACSKTTEWDGKFMMYNNYQYSKELLHYSIKFSIPFIYASSAAVYGASKSFKELPENEKPLNVYGYSKYQFDQYVTHLLPKSESQIVGLRYFNVYGPREFHKNSMASVALHNHHQIIKENMVHLFVGSDGFDNGEQRRDFIYVDDVVDVNLWFAQNPDKSGIFNVGTGRSQPFNDVANAVINWHQKGKIDYIPFPDHLVGRYQSFTEADISKLRDIGYDKPFKAVEEGVKEYLDWLAENE